MNVNLTDYRIVLVSVYLLLLSASYIIQLVFPPVSEANRYEKIIQTDSLESSNGSIRYYQIETANENASNPLLLFPDIYYGAEFLLPIAEKLAKDRDVIILLYSGERDRPDNLTGNSIKSKTSAASILLNGLKIDSVHVAGQAYGAAVSTRFLDEHPETVKSLTMISGLGVQELHFLGNHTLNKLIFSVLKPVTWTFKYLIPHFGWYYNQPINSHFSTELLNLDISNHREILKNVEVPVKILHAADDRYIPVQTAEEHHRIIPQSDLELINGFHKSIFNTSAKWASEISSFLKKADRGRATFKADASRERIEKSEKVFDRSQVVAFTGWVFFLILGLIAFSSVLNEDIAGIGGGLLAARGLIGFWDAVIACFLGIVIFDVIVYWIGRIFGSRVIRKAPFKWMLDEQDIKKAETMFELRGLEILFAAKFIPGTRFPTYFSAGLLKSNFLFFMLYFVASVIIWVPLIVGISMIAGQTLLTFFQKYQEYFAVLAIVSGILIYLIVKYLQPFFTVKGRRKLIEKWKRK